MSLRTILASEGIRVATTTLKKVSKSAFASTVFGRKMDALYMYLSPTYGNCYCVPGKRMDWYQTMNSVCMTIGDPNGYGQFQLLKASGVFWDLEKVYPGLTFGPAWAGGTAATVVSGTSEQIAAIMDDRNGLRANLRAEKVEFPFNAAPSKGARGAVNDTSFLVRWGRSTATDEES